MHAQISEPVGLSGLRAVVSSVIGYVVARREVRSALRVGLRTPAVNSDALPPVQVPSLRYEWQSGSSQRVLAEIDQDGFTFALDDRDRELFPGRHLAVLRRHHRVQIVWSSGAVRIRKELKPRKQGILSWLQWDLYVEAAALLRLRGAAGVPIVREINLRGWTVEMDYIWGRDLRHEFNDQDSLVNYPKVTQAFNELLRGTNRKASCDELAALLRRVVKLGVVPRDLHAANVIRAFPTGRLYLVDFNFVYLPPSPS
ncbi:MAG: hypothetical protein ACRD1C_10040 [Terriglobales bacterium]